MPHLIRFVPLLVVLLSCYWFAFKPSRRVATNLGEVCFETSPTPFVATAHVTASGCTSSSCTRVIQENTKVEVDNQRREIRFTSRFVLESPRRFGIHGCTTDCHPAGLVKVPLTALHSGVYSIWLGRSQIGTWEIDAATWRAHTFYEFSPESPLCFGNTSIYRVTKRPTIGPDWYLEPTPFVYPDPYLEQTPLPRVPGG